MNTPEFELYWWNTPNGQKITIALDEVGANYKRTPINITKGEQHEPAFKSISPDGKIPALVHHGSSPVTLFESGAILMYLAERYPQLHGLNEDERASVAAWTFWQVGQLGPFAGQFGRFHTVNPPNPDAIKHFEALVWRCLDVMEKRLEESAFLAGDRFTVADITCITWVASPKSYLQIYELPWRESKPALVRWANTLLDKPSVKSALNPPST